MSLDADAYTRAHPSEITITCAIRSPWKICEGASSRFRIYACARISFRDTRRKRAAQCKDTRGAKSCGGARVCVYVARSWRERGRSGPGRDLHRTISRLIYPPLAGSGEGGRARERKGERERKAEEEEKADVFEGFISSALYGPWGNKTRAPTAATAVNAYIPPPTIYVCTRAWGYTTASWPLFARFISLLPSPASSSSSSSSSSFLISVATAWAFSSFLPLSRIPGHANLLFPFSAAVGAARAFFARSLHGRDLARSFFLSPAFSLHPSYLCFSLHRFHSFLSRAGFYFFLHPSFYYFLSSLVSSTSISPPLTWIFFNIFFILYLLSSWFGYFLHAYSFRHLIPRKKICMFIKHDTSN